MKMALQLNIKHEKIVKKILSQQLNLHKVYVFGSRATNKASKFSDLDLCLDGKNISFAKLLSIKEAFSESDLPFFVDIVQKESLSDGFYKMIKNDFVELNFRS